MTVYKPGTSGAYGGGSSFGPSSELLRAQQQNINMEIITGANPWLAQDPQTLLALAQSGMDPEQLANQAGAMAGMEGLDRMAQALSQMSPIAQRSAYGKLTEQQQRGLNAMGWAPQGGDQGGGFLDGTILEKPWDWGWGATDAVAGVAMKPLAATVGPVLGIGFDALAWASDVPAHFYRAIRQMEGWQQLLAAGTGAAAGILAAPAVAAGTAGMGTLALVGGVGGAVLGGAVLGTAPTALTSTTEWWDMMNPWGATGVRRGERIFTAGSQRRANQILGGASHIDAMARDIAANMDAYDFAQEFAGRTDAGDINVMTQAIEKVATTFADPGTEEYAKIYEGLAQLIEMPEFRSAVEELNHGKISFGRDAASMFGLDPGTAPYNIVSGGLDAVWLVTMDPTLALGKVGKLARMTRRGVTFDHSPEATARIADIIAENQGVANVVDQMAKGINDNNFELIPRAWRRMHGPITEWMEQRGQLTFDRADFLEFIDDAQNFGAIMAGAGNVRGLEPIVLSTVNRSEGWGKFMHSIRRFQEGMTDEVYEATMRREAKRFGMDDALEHKFPAQYHETKMDFSWQPVRAHPLTDPTYDSYVYGAAAGEIMAKIPGGRSLGRFIGNISTMTPPNRYIMLSGDQALEDIPRFVETIGRHFSMNSAARKQWLNNIMEQGTVGQRRQVIYSFMNNIFEVGGMNATDEGRELAARYLNKYKQAFGPGGLDEIRVGGLERNVGYMPDIHQSDALMVPNLREMAKISRNGLMIKHVAKLTDAQLLEGMMSRYIKPGWLLRIGFIPRNAGEEMLAFAVRMTEGGIIQELGARNVGTRNVWKQVYAALEEAGGDVGKLSPDMQRVLTRDEVPTFMKPLAAMGRRTGWAKLQREPLQRRADWLATQLSEGITKWTPAKDMPQWQHDLFLGRKHSLRHMLVQGVDPTLVKAGELWTMRHSDAVMKAVSSLNSSVFERALVHPNSKIMAIPNDEGVYENVAVVLTGERGKVHFGDFRYAGSLHHQMTEWLGDERIAGVLADYGTRLFVDQGGLLKKANVVEALELSRVADGYAGRTLLQEMLQWRPENVHAAASKFDNFPEFQHALRQASMSSDPDKLSVIIQEMKNHAAEKAILRSEITYDDAGKAALLEVNERMEMVTALGEQFEALRPLYEGLDALSDSERAWMAALISRDQGKRLDMASLKAWADGTGNKPPKLVFTRGVPNMKTIRENADGSLTLIPQTQNHLGARKGVSMSLDPYQSAMFTRQAKGASSIDVSSGMHLEIDGEWALQTNNMTLDDLHASARNYKDANPEEEAGLGLWGMGDSAATEVTWLSDTEITIPANKWRMQTPEEFAELQLAASKAGPEVPHAATFANEMSQTIGGYEVGEALKILQAHKPEEMLANMPAELHVQLRQLLEQDAEQWKLYHEAALAGTDATMPAPLLDFDPSTGGGELAALEQYLDNWMDSDPRLRELLRETEARVGGLADYMREALGMPTVKSLDPLQQGKTGYRVDHRTAMRQFLETDVSIRGKGQFLAPELDGWSPMYDDFQEWETALENAIYETLARPENADVVRKSDHMLQGPDGQPVAMPPAEGVSRLYQPVVPRDIGHLDGLLTSTRFQPQLEQEIQESLSQLARVLDNPRLPKAQATLWGEIQHLANASIDGMPAGTHPINQQAQTVAAAIRNGRGNNEVQKAIMAGEQLTANPNIYEQAERVLTASTRQKRWDDVAREMVRTPRSIRYTDDTVHAMSEDEKIAIVSRALRAIESNKAYYSQPIETTLEQMAFDSPSIARWLTSVLHNGPMDAATSARVGQIDVARKAIQSTGEWNSGVRLASVDNGTGVGRFWQLDDTLRGASIPMDASTVHWFGRGEAPAIGSGRMVEHGNFVVGSGYDAALKNWAKTIRENWVATQRRGIEEAVTVKAEGIARRGLNGYEPVPVGTRLELTEDFYEIDKKGNASKAVDFGDTRYFDHEIVGQEDDLMWGILGPAMRDHWETVSGDTTKLLRRVNNKSKKVLDKVTNENMTGEEIITMTRSRLDDIQTEGTAVPNLVVHKKYEQMHDTRWDRMVRYGFNKVIGPIMDSVSRKPMSFHYFAQAYSQNMEMIPWLLDTQLFRNAIPEQFGDLLHLFEGETNLTDAERVATRAVALTMGEDLSKANPNELKQFLLSLGDDADDVKRALLDAQVAARGTAVQRMIGAGADGSQGLSIAGTPEMALSEHIDTLLHSTNFDLIRYGIDSPGLGASNAERFVEYYHDLVPDEVWEEGAVAVKAFLDDIPGTYSEFTPDQWRVLHAARGNLKHAFDLAEDTASIRAMENVVPFLDSHEQRSMMAEYGRNFIPFWYAQENFIKRWARTFSTSPVWGADQLRKMQLTYMGLKSSAVVRTDENGKDWVVYPGSGLLVEAVGAIPGMEHKPLGVLFQASTDSMLPGIESDLGSSSVSPFVAMPVHLVSHFFPESQPLKRTLLGEVGASRSIMSQFVPGVAQNMWSAAFDNEESSARYASAMMTAISMSEANGEGLKEGATAYEVDEYLDEMRNHARVILFAQAITGYISPGAPSSIATGEDVGSFGWLTGVGVSSPGQLASAMYRQYLSNLGPEKGTEAFLTAFPKADLEDVVDPLAFTTSMSESVSRAPLPATAVGMKWYNDNKGWIDASPEAGAWFLPSDNSNADFDYYSYSQQFTNGLRKRKSPQEFITAIKYRTGADIYFKEKERYEEAQLKIGQDNPDGLAQAKILWDNWKLEYLTAHPIFAEELQSGDSRVRRQRTIDQLRYAVSDPLAPKSPHSEGIAKIVEEFDRYQAMLSTLKFDRTAEGQEKKREIKRLFEDWAERWKRDNPQLDRLWSSVYRPESGLE